MRLAASCLCYACAAIPAVMELSRNREGILAEMRSSLAEICRRRRFRLPTEPTSEALSKCRRSLSCTRADRLSSYRFISGADFVTLRTSLPCLILCHPQDRDERFPHYGWFT